MGLCCNKPVDPHPGEYDPSGSLTGGVSPIVDLSRPIRNLVKQGRVLFWRDAQLRVPAYYVNLHPPFFLESVSGHRKVRIQRKQEEEESNRLAFEGVCDQGFVYKVFITARALPATRRRGRWRSGSNVEYTGMVHWVKKPETPADYGVDYEILMRRR